MINKKINDSIKKMVISIIFLSLSVIFLSLIWLLVTTLDIISFDIDPSSISKIIKADIPIVGSADYVLKSMLKIIKIYYYYQIKIVLRVDFGNISVSWFPGYC